MDLRGIDQAADVCVVDDVLRKQEVFLERRWSSGRTIDLVERGESRRSPDNEASEVATGCELQEVEGKDGGCFDTRDVTESMNQLLAVFMWVVDDQGATSLAVATSSELSLPGSQFAGAGDLFHVRACTDCFEKLDGSGGAGDGCAFKTF